MHGVRYGSTQTAANLLATLKSAELPDHISIDHVLNGDNIYFDSHKEKLTKMSSEAGTMAFFCYLKHCEVC